MGPKTADVLKPRLISSPLWGPPRRGALCSHIAHLWAPKMANCDFLFVLGTPKRAGVM